MINLVKQLFSCALALTISTFALANGVEIIQQDLVWSDLHPENKSVSSNGLFLNSSYDLAFGNIPCIVHKVPLTSNGHVTDIRWAASESTTIPGVFLKELDTPFIQNNWQVNGKGKIHLLKGVKEQQLIAGDEISF